MTAPREALATAIVTAILGPHSLCQDALRWAEAEAAVLRLLPAECGHGPLLKEAADVLEMSHSAHEVMLTQCGRCDLIARLRSAASGGEGAT